MNEHILLLLTTALISGMLNETDDKIYNKHTNTHIPKKKEKKNEKTEKIKDRKLKLKEKNKKHHRTA